ncbi:MAG: PTS cellobiose transporter subunit IIB [Hyphomicrobiaceae bacterium]|nr:PTS cellobiose transporter subunit IIB [Hyphomicrobiaceae bacterium]
MPLHLRTTVTEVGEEAADLAEGGVVILFAEGAPPELAEVSLLHRVSEGPSGMAPGIGTPIRIGALEAPITAIGDSAWKKVTDIGHVVISFTGAEAAERPGEIIAGKIDGETLAAALQPGAEIVIGS